MLTHAHQRRFHDAGYTARYIEAEDPQLVDDEIQIFRGAFNTGVTIQIGLSGLFYVNEFIDGLMTAYGEYRTMSHAIDRALEICEAQTLSGTLKRLGFTHVPQKRDIHQGRRILEIATNKDANAKWYATLTPSKTAFGQWKWIGRKAFLRTPAGVFELSEYSGGTHGDVAGLDGTFTATTGAQSHMVFRFNDFLTATNPTKNTNYDAARDALKGWWNRGSVDWYIGVPASMKPFHEAINEWVLMWTGAP